MEGEETPPPPTRRGNTLFKHSIYIYALSNSDVTFLQLFMAILAVMLCMYVDNQDVIIDYCNVTVSIIYDVIHPRCVCTCIYRTIVSVFGAQCVHKQYK